MGRIGNGERLSEPDGWPGNVRIFGAKPSKRAGSPLGAQIGHMGPLCSRWANPCIAGGVRAFRMHPPPPAIRTFLALYRFGYRSRYISALAHRYPHIPNHQNRQIPTADSAELRRIKSQPRRKSMRGIQCVAIYSSHGHEMGNIVMSVGGITDWPHRKWGAAGAVARMRGLPAEAFGKFGFPSAVLQLAILGFLGPRGATAEENPRVPNATSPIIHTFSPSRRFGYPSRPISALA